MADTKEKKYVSDDAELLAEWHWEKNAAISPYELAYGSDKEVWWHCATCGHDFTTRVANRTGHKHVGCSVCNKYLHTSFPEQAVFYYIKKVFPLAENKYTTVFENRMELDIFIPELNTGIEYDGSYWHSEDAFERNKKKYEICRQILSKCVPSYKAVKQVALTELEELPNDTSPQFGYGRDGGSKWYTDCKKRW